MMTWQGWVHAARRWVNCLLVREIPFSLAIRLWDTYLAEGPRMRDFLTYVLAAFLLTWAPELRRMDFQVPDPALAPACMRSGAPHSFVNPTACMTPGQACSVHKLACMHVLWTLPNFGAMVRTARWTVQLHARQRLAAAACLLLLGAAADVGRC